MTGAVFFDPDEIEREMRRAQAASLAKPQLSAAFDQIARDHDHLFDGIVQVCRGLVDLRNRQRPQFDLAFVAGVTAAQIICAAGCTDPAATRLAIDICLLQLDAQRNATSDDATASIVHGTPGGRA